MRHGFVVPFASETEFVELARLGEQAGWDAVLSWEGVWRQDAWVQLGAAAVATERIRLGSDAGGQLLFVLAGGIVLAAAMRRDDGEDR